MPLSSKRSKEIYEHYKANSVVNKKGYYCEQGVEACVNLFGYSASTIKKAIRVERRGTHEEEEPQKPLNGTLQRIQDLYTKKELEAIASGGRIVPGLSNVPVISFDGEHIRIGVMSDTHIGSSYTNSDYIFQAFEEFRKANVDFVVHSGDVVEGMSNRPGHIYELSHLGYNNQRDEAIRIFGEWTDTKMYMIDGNHDRWFIKSNGAIIVKDISDALENIEFIGHDEGDISLNGKATLKLWHGGDGNSYALSYRLQKIIESFSGGEKPDVLICGHTHKFVHIFERMVHTVSAGSIQRQTDWMRGKRIAAHVGFCIIDVWVNDDGVSKFQCEWLPFYT